MVDGNQQTPGGPPTSGVSNLGATPYGITPAQINYNNFNNPVGDQSQNWQAGMQNYLGATTGKAPQAGYQQLGSAATYGGANIGQTATYGGAQLNGQQYGQVLGQQQGLANQLQQQAQGLGPSVAQVQAQQSANQNLQSQMAMLGSQRGSSNPALAQQQALNAGANAQQQAAGQAVLGRTQEALGAQSNLANLYGTMGGQTQNFAATQAGLQQQAGLASMGAINQQNQAQAQLYQQAGLSNQGAQNQFNLQQGSMNQGVNLANLQAGMQQNQLNAQQYNQYMNLLQQQNLSQYQGQMAGEQLGVQQNLGYNQIAASAYGQAAANQQQVLGGAIQLGSNVAGLPWANSGNSGGNGSGDVTPRSGGNTYGGGSGWNSSGEGGNG